jgi:hypothetical protein
MAKLGLSAQALIEAKKLVAYIDYFETHGTGDLMRRYPDDDAFGGYDNIIRRARELADKIEAFDTSRPARLAAQASRAA